MPDTTLGITYPPSTDHSRLWEHFQELAEDVDTLIAADRAARDAAWTSYTPTITGSTSGTWTQGNGTVTAAYHRDGRKVTVQGTIVFGSTSSFASIVGSLRVSLPSGVAAVGTSRPLFGAGDIIDTSASARWTYVLRIDTTTTFTLMRYDGAFAAPTSPMTWATGDTLDFWGVYESASAP
jgi:hypothetical protein